MKTQFTINQDTFNSYAFELAKDDLYKIDRRGGMLKFKGNTIVIDYEYGNHFQEEDAEELEQEITGFLFSTIGGEFDIAYLN